MKGNAKIQDQYVVNSDWEGSKISRYLRQKSVKLLKQSASDLQSEVAVTIHCVQKENTLTFLFLHLIPFKFILSYKSLYYVYLYKPFTFVLCVLCVFLSLISFTLILSDVLTSTLYSMEFINTYVYKECT